MRRKLLFSILTVSVGLLALEGIARLMEINLRPPVPDRVTSGWQQEFFSSLFDWHEPDPDLLWRFKANLNNPLITTNSQHLLGDSVPGRKQPGELRILVLGDSSPVGLGLKSRQQAFPELLRRLLNVSCVSYSTVTVINASVSGYTSEQIVRYLELHGSICNPDIIVLYCGNNDASISGPLTDQQLLSAQRMRSTRRALSHLATYRMLRSIILSAGADTDDKSADLSVRVSPSRFGQNLRRIAQQCQRLRCRLIVLKPAVPYLWPAGLQFKVFTHVTGRDDQVIVPPALTELLERNIKYCFSAEMFRKFYGSGDFFTRAVYRSAYSDSLAPEAAIEYYRQLLRERSDDPVCLNNLGVSYWQAGDVDMAGKCLVDARRAYVQQYLDPARPVSVAAGSPFLYNTGIAQLFAAGGGAETLTDTISIPSRYLDSALQADYFSLRIKRDYLREIDAVGQLPDVTVIDLPQVFRDHGGDHLFLDHCHPTPAGHWLIAQALAETICARTQGPAEAEAYSITPRSDP